jgi:S1-C subfamily serine protease
MPRFAPLAVLLAAAATGCSGDSETQTVTITSERAAVRASSGATGSFDRIPEIVDAVEPSVVAVQTDGGEGSGVIWTEDGTIVTNHHVVAGESEARVVLVDGTRLEAQVQASDPLTDLAVLRVQRDGLPAAQFATTLPEVGELAVAIGNPLGFENTVSQGIVSGVHRALPTGAEARLVDLIQTDAAISPGNSGGALVDADARVIGINVAYAPPTEGAVAIGFAIPAEVVRDVVTELSETGRVRHAYLGVRTVDVTPDLAEAVDLPVEEGVVVQSVEPGSPADRGGISPADVIVRFGDREVRAVEDLFAELRDYDPGDRVVVTVARGDGRRELTVTLGELDA